MTVDPAESGGSGSIGVLSWLRAPVTLTLPGWAFAAGGLALVLLVILALD